VLVVGDLLHEHGPDALRDGAVDLAVDEHGLIMRPQSSTTTYFRIFSWPVAGSISTSETCVALE